MGYLVVGAVVTVIAYCACVAGGRSEDRIKKAMDELHLKKEKDK